MRYAVYQALCLLILSFQAGSHLVAQETVRTLSAVSWISEPGKEKRRLLLDSSTLLTAAQRKLIYSGFPAYSLVDISMVKEGREDILVSRICSVRYELWDEVLRLTQKDKDIQERLLSFEDYQKECLQISFDVPDHQDPKKPADFYATVQFTQLSGDGSSRIRDWLIQQQSSILRSLFSHMLGELRVSEHSSARFQIPKPSPRPEKPSPEQTKEQPEKDQI